VVQTNENTIDSSSGEVLSGLTLFAPSGSEVVSPLTTLINEIVGEQESNESDANYQSRINDFLAPLNLPQGVDPTTFNPFDTDDLSVAKAVETAAQQITAVVNTIAKAIEAAGGDGEAAATRALDQVATQLNNGETITSSSTIQTILSSVHPDSIVAADANDIAIASTRDEAAASAAKLLGSNGSFCCWLSILSSTATR